MAASSLRLVGNCDACCADGELVAIRCGDEVHSLCPSCASPVRCDACQRPVPGGLTALTGRGWRVCAGCAREELGIAYLGGRPARERLVRDDRAMDRLLRDLLMEERT